MIVGENKNNQSNLLLLVLGLVSELGGRVDFLVGVLFGFLEFCVGKKKG